MGLLRRKTRSEPQDRVAELGAGLGESALYALGAVLRTLAELEPESATRGTLEGWTRHVLTLGPVPGTEGASSAAGQRDWNGVRDAIVQNLRKRARSVEQQVGALRESVAALTRSLGKTLSEGREGDARAATELQRLRHAALHQSPEEVKRCALETVELVSGVIAERERRHRELTAQLHARAESLQERLSDAEREKLLDPLTGLANRRSFDAELVHALEAVSVLGEPCALLLFDLDRFKAVNDRHGHVAGDAVLRAFSGALALSFPRRSDCVARFGGEEFAVLLRASSLHDAVRLAERARERVRSLAVAVGGERLSITVSAGVAPLAPGQPPEDAIARADQALYRAKAEGRDRVVASAP